ncbi:MAG: YihY/virulence factor BrkB family protein [Steroidobacteraceae bacterium]
MTFKQARNLVQTAIKAWSDDYAPSMGAALSYYTLFSVAPLLLIVIAVAGMVFGQDAARGEIFLQLNGLLGEPGAKAIQSLLESVNRPAEGVAATLVGFLLLGVGATTVFAELQDALDRIWRAPARAKSSGIIALLRARLLSFGLILCIGFLLIVSLILSAAVAALGKWSSSFIGWELLVQMINLLVSFVLTAVVFAMIYKFMPRVHIHWKDVWIGACVTALLLGIGKLLIGIYIGKSGVVSGFGAAASLVVVLVWVYYSAQLFLMGAEFTWVYAHTFGSRKGLPLPSAQVPGLKSDHEMPGA